MKKNILFRIGTLQAGGAERMLVDIINNMDTNLYDITLLLNVNYGVFKSQLRKDITFRYLYEDKEWPFISNHLPIFSRLIRYIKHKIYSKFPFLIEKIILKNKKYNISVSFIQDMVNEGYKTKANNKIIWVHALLSNYVDQFPGVEKQLSYFKQYDKIMVISQEVKKDVITLFPSLKDKIQILLNPVNKELIKEKSLAFYPKEFEPYKQKLKLVAVGRITHVKGFLRLVDVKKKLDEQNINCELFIVGREDNKEFAKKLKDKIKQLGVEIHLIGHKENPYPYIKNADILINSSIHEGYGLVLAEGLLLETPVIGSDIKAFKEFANDEVFYVSNDNEKFANEAIEKIKLIMNGEKKGSLSNTNIMDIKEYVTQLNSIF